MAAEETWVILVEWEDSPVMDATEMVVRAACERKAVEIASSDWRSRVGKLYPSCVLKNAIPIKRGDAWLVDLGIM
jgi:hypothetical protein